MSETVAKICKIPRDFHSGKNKSISELFEETGYLKNPEFVTRETLHNHLFANPDLVQDWENYSADKRSSRAWYLLKHKSEWVVGYVGAKGQEQKQTYLSGFEACAEFILHELKEFEESVR